jgi:hypothetical protein
LTSIFFSDENTGFITGDGGTIWKTTNGGGIVGINEKEQPGSLKIYPVPATEYITIELDGTGSIMIGTVSIYGMTGQEMIKLNVNDSKIMIDVKSLPASIYFARLIHQEGNARATIGLGKFVKN